MYQQFFNFNTAPFSIAPDPHFIFMSEHHQEGLAHLMYGINQGGGFVALTGEVGTGKTTLCHCLLEQLPDNIDIALVLNPKVNAIELLATVCDELQITYTEDQQTLKNLVDKLNNHLLATHAAGRRTVLMLDEAQNLSLDVLEQIRLLTNLETSKTKLLQIILVGQPELKLLLEKPELRQLNQRITARYHLVPLTFNETVQYIQHRLKVCGGNTQIFNHRTSKKIFGLSKGIPRLINILCDRALLGAYASDTQQVTIKIINKAASEIFNLPEKSNIGLIKTCLLGLVFFCFLAVYFFYPKPKQQNIIQPKPIKVPVIEQPLPEVPVMVLPDKTPTPPITTAVLETSIQQQKLSLDEALYQLAKIWNIEIELGSGCTEIESKNADIRCLLDSSEWQQLIDLNRPVILEFSINEQEKDYALLIGLKNGQPIFSVNSEATVPLEQILTTWDGYYLTLWRSPIVEIKEAHPGQKSNSIIWIREQLVKNHGQLLKTIKSDLFDDQLKNEVIKFQQKKQLITDGIVGPRTFIHLQNQDQQDNSPKLNLDY